MRISEAATGVGEQMADVGLAMQRAVDKTENMKRRADAVSELEAAGTFDDIAALGGGEDDIDRQLERAVSSSRPSTTSWRDEGRSRRRRGSRRRQIAEQAGAAAARRSTRAQMPQAPSGAVDMIVRISGEDQVQLADSDAGQLNELENRVAALVEAAARMASQAYGALLDLGARTARR